MGDMDWSVLRRKILSYYGSMNAPGGGLWPRGAAESLPFGYEPHQSLLAGLARVGRLWTDPAENDPADEELASLFYGVSTSSGSFGVSVSFVGPYVAVVGMGDQKTPAYAVSRESTGLSQDALAVLNAIRKAGFHVLSLAELRTRTDLNVQEYEHVNVYQALFVNRGLAPDLTEHVDTEA